MKFIKKNFNNDPEHQYMIRYDGLLSINIFFEKKELKNIINKLLEQGSIKEYDLVEKEVFKICKYLETMYYSGTFNFTKDIKKIISYLQPNNKLIFLLNYFYQKAEKNISLTNEDLKLLYEIQYNETIGANEVILNLIYELKNHIIFEIKGNYSYNRIKKRTLESAYILTRENLSSSFTNILGILENARDNSNIIYRLNLNLNTGFQKTKA